MSLIDVLEISGIVLGGITITFTGTIGFLQAKSNYRNASKFYEDANDDIKDIIGKPNKTKIYFQSIADAPKLLYFAAKNKSIDDAFYKYVLPLEKAKGKEFMRLYCAMQLWTN